MRKDRRTLEDNALNKFIYFESDIEEENYARDIITFGLYGNGMNIRDLFHLQSDNITDKYISFVRIKTKRMTSETIKIRILLTDNILKILKKWGTSILQSMNLFWRENESQLLMNLHISKTKSV